MTDARIHFKGMFFIHIEVCSKILELFCDLVCLVGIGWYFLGIYQPIPKENLVGTFWYCKFGRNPIFAVKRGSNFIFYLVLGRQGRSLMKKKQQRSNKIESCWSAAVMTLQRQEKDGILPLFCIARCRQASGKGRVGF